MSKSNSNARKDALLGEPHGTATNRLRKMLLFKLVQIGGFDVCYRCRETIKSINDFSIEHMESWQSAQDPRAAFFDLEKIVFSHLRCNVAAAEPVRKKYFTPEALRKARTQQSLASKKLHYSPEKRHQAYVDGRW